MNLKHCALLLCCIAVPTIVTTAAETHDDNQLFTKLDMNEDGVLSGKEVKSFLQFDMDGDGEVTKAEFVAGMAAERKRLLAIDDQLLFKDRDGNRDGVLSGTEVRGFENYDADGDGEVSWLEFQKGRAAERGVPDKAEQSRLAAEAFRKLDLNEDGRLSGKEMIGYEKLDLDGDGRITEKEFVAGFTNSAPAVDPVAAFLEFVRTNDSTSFMAAVDAEFAKEIEEPVITFIVRRLTDALGPLKSAAKNALRPSQKMTTTNQPVTVYAGKLPFKKGTVQTSLIVGQGRIVGLRLESPTLDDVGDRLHRALMEDAEFGKSTAVFYTPKCTEFIRLILAEEDDQAFSKYHPEVQQSIGREKAQNLFELFRARCGQFKGIELETIDVQFGENGKGENFKLTYIVRGSVQDYSATVTLQFVGMSAHITGLSIKPAELTDPGDKPTPLAANDLQWVKVTATEEELTFEMPGKPERTFDDATKQVVYRYNTPDNYSFWTVILEPLGADDKFTPEEFFEERKGILTQDAKWELLSSKKFNLGIHPGKTFFLKQDQLYSYERTILVGRRFCSFQLSSVLPDQELREKMANHFLESVKLLVAAPPDAPAPPAPPPPSKTKPPAP